MLNTLLVVALMAPIPIITTSKTCRPGVTCVRTKKPRPKTRRPRVRRRRTQAQLRVRKTKRVTPLKRSNAKEPPKTTAKRTTETLEQQRRHRLINLWIRQILQSDPALRFNR